MALMWTTVEDVKDRWVGDPLPADDAKLAVLLEDAEDTILREYPDMPDRVDSTTYENPIPRRRVAKVAARMVMRHLRNPGGVRQVQDLAGPFQQATTFGGDEPGALYLTDEDRAELDGTKGDRAFQIDTTPADAVFMDCPPDPWEVCSW